MISDLCARKYLFELFLIIDASNLGLVLIITVKLFYETSN